MDRFFLYYNYTAVKTYNTVIIVAIFSCKTQTETRIMTTYWNRLTGHS